MIYPLILPNDSIVQGVVWKLSDWLNNFCTIEHNGDTFKHSENVCFVGLHQDTLFSVVYLIKSKLGYDSINGENEDVILKQCQLDLLKLASPDAILRLSKSKLGSESKIVSKTYFGLKLLSLADYLQQLSRIGMAVEDDTIPKLSFVTTHSSLLTETDISELIEELETYFPSEDLLCITNLYLNQLQTEKEFVSSIHDLLTSVPSDIEERNFVLIQCEDGYSNHDLISCAKFRMLEILSELKSNLNSNFHILFIVKLLSTRQDSSFSGYCGLLWDSVYIDELRPSHHNLLPSFDIIQNLTIAEIFNYKFPVC